MLLDDVNLSHVLVYYYCRRLVQNINFCHTCPARFVFMYVDDDEHEEDEPPTRIRVRTYVRVDGDNNQVRRRYVTTEHFNTSVCESTFAHIHRYGGAMRRMKPARSQFFIREITQSHAEKLTIKLDREGMNPVPNVGDSGMVNIEIQRDMLGFVAL